MTLESLSAGTPGGPFRLLKYFIISGFVVIAVVTALLGAFLYSKSVEALLLSAENYAKLLAENLNYNVYSGFYAPLKAREITIDLRKWDQFGALDSLIKDFTYGLKIQRIKIIDRNRKIIYSTEYDLIGKEEPKNQAIDEALNGKDSTYIRQDKTEDQWYGKRLAETYFPLREITGNYWMLGTIYGVIQITQDVTDQYVNVQRSIMVVIIVAAGLMAFLFVTLTLIVRRGERILMLRAKERKLLEEQLQQSEKLASIGQMIATVAHEIRNPLGIIRSSAEVLVKKTNPEPARVQKLSGIIVEEATRLSSILTDFLEFARPRSPSMQSIDVRDAISRARNNLGEEISSRGIKWVDHESNGFTPLVLGDLDLLYQAFLNIAMNAFEAMDTGGIFATNIRREDSRIRIDFSDTGHGIKQADIQKIFTPFFTSHEMGTGLGLSVVHNIITAHRGEISVTSEEGRGAVFSISLPEGEPDAVN